MNLLIDLVPDTVNIENVEYEINTDFRISILFELLMQDESILDDERMRNALRLYYPIVPDNLSLAVKNIIWFYKCGKEDTVLNEEETEKSNKDNQIYSFEYDDEYIYSAFLDQYGIDLQDVDHLHWWKFRALFKGLKDDNLISKIMSYRSIEISDKMQDGERLFYKRMKQIYALPDSRTQEEKEDDFNSSMSRMF